MEDKSTDTHEDFGRKIYETCKMNKLPKKLKKLNTARSSKLETDIILKCSDGLVYAHKGMLRVMSDYFDVLFDTHMTESISNEIDLSAYSSESVDFIICCLYCEDVEQMLPKLNQDLLIEVLSISHMILENEIFEYAWRATMALLDCNNFVHIWNLAILYEQDVSCIIKLITDNMAKVLQENLMVDLTPGQIRHFYGNSEINDITIELLFKWTEHDLLARIGAAVAEFQFIDLKRFSREFICSALTNSHVVAHSEIIKNKFQSEVFRTYIEDGKAKPSLYLNRHCIKGGVLTKHRYSFNEKAWLFPVKVPLSFPEPRKWKPMNVAGGSCEELFYSTVNGTIDIHDCGDRKSVGPSLNDSSFCRAFQGDFLYVLINGSDDYAFWRFHLKSFEWQQLSRCRRSEESVFVIPVVNYQKIYLVETLESKTRLFVYDAELDLWKLQREFGDSLYCMFHYCGNDNFKNLLYFWNGRKLFEYGVNTDKLTTVTFPLEGVEITDAWLCDDW